MSWRSHPLLAMPVNIDVTRSSLAEILPALFAARILPPRRHRLKLRLSFREWSRLVDKDGLRSTRAWLTRCEDVLNGAGVPPDPDFAD